MADDGPVAIGSLLETRITMFWLYKKQKRHSFISVNFSFYTGEVLDNGLYVDFFNWILTYNQFICWHGNYIANFHRDVVLNSTSSAIGRNIHIIVARKGYYLAVYVRGIVCYIAIFSQFWLLRTHITNCPRRNENTYLVSCRGVYPKYGGFVKCIGSFTAHKPRYSSRYLQTRTYVL